MLRLYPFRTLYLADLDAIMGRPAQLAIVWNLRQRFPGIELWLDQGRPDTGASLWPPLPPDCVPVLGSESLNATDLPELAHSPKEFILSLDFREDRLLGPERLATEPTLWPKSLILMNLCRVGSGTGPAFEQLQRFRETHPDRRFVAAGGVRDPGDLARLKDLGAAAVLVASALHTGSIDDKTLRQYAPH